jgi:hypothetical protein
MAQVGFIAPNACRWVCTSTPAFFKTDATRTKAGPRTTHAPDQSKSTVVSTMCSSLQPRIALPWQTPAYVAQAMLTTSFETCVVEHFSEDAAPNTLLRCTVDTQATCTADQYRLLGQWVWLKPWGDEDGNVLACPIASPPNGNATVILYAPVHSPVGHAVRAGEMLEVSEVCGTGFRALGNDDDDAPVRNLEQCALMTEEVGKKQYDVFGFAKGASTLSVLQAFRFIGKQLVAGPRGGAGTSPRFRLFLFRTENAREDDGAFAHLAETWAHDFALDLETSFVLGPEDIRDRVASEDCQSSDSLCLVSCSAPNLVETVQEVLRLELGNIYSSC